MEFFDRSTMPKIYIVNRILKIMMNLPRECNREKEDYSFYFIYGKYRSLDVQRYRPLLVRTIIGSGPSLDWR